MLTDELWTFMDRREQVSYELQRADIPEQPMLCRPGGRVFSFRLVNTLCRMAGIACVYEMRSRRTKLYGPQLQMTVIEDLYRPILKALMYGDKEANFAELTRCANAWVPKRYAEAWEASINTNKLAHTVAGHNPTLRVWPGERGYDAAQEIQLRRRSGKLICGGVQKVIDT